MATYPSNLTVNATLNGTTYTLTWDSATSSYTAELTAPGATSYNLTGGVYTIDITAANDYGTSTTGSTTLQVYETVAPTITLLSPTENATVGTVTPTVIFNATDEAGGSGINSATATIDGTAVTLVSTAITNGYRYTSSPALSLGNGTHTLVITATDNDGNKTAKSFSFTVDTVPPVLSVTSPADGTKYGSYSVAVKGTTNDAISSSVTVAIWVVRDGITYSKQSPSVNASGDFSVTLTSQQGIGDGTNEIHITSTDAIGNVTTIVRTVSVDTSALTIESATVTPEKSATGSKVVISVKVSSQDNTA